jgi:hypothetical protein
MKLIHDSPKPHRSLKVQTADTAETPLTPLEQATRQVLTFEHKNRQLFETYRAMLEEVHVAEEAVKTYVKKHKVTLEGDLFIVEYGEGFHRWYEPDATISIAARLLGEDRDDVAQQLAKAKVVAAVASVDEKKLKKFCHLHDLDIKRFTKARNSEQTQTRATIKRKL